MLISGMFTVELPMGCSRCKRMFFSRHRVNVNQLTPRQLEEEAKTQIPNIPVGWAMNGRYDIRCPEHMK